MSDVTLLREVLRRARGRRGLDTVFVWLPWIALAAVIAARWGGEVACAVVGAGAILLLFLAARARVQRLDTGWLVRELDARRPDFEDSTDLLFASPDAM